MGGESADASVDGEEDEAAHVLNGAGCMSGTAISEHIVGMG